MSKALLDVSNLHLRFANTHGMVDLVHDVSFSLAEGEILGLVGESGAGKSLTCRALIRLLPPKVQISQGRIVVMDSDITALDEEALRKIRGSKLGMIFQNPGSFFDPVMTIGDQIAETLRVKNGLSRREARIEAIKLLDRVRIADPATRAHSYPHECSGGMLQRAMIAATLACSPKILIADEPTTALDVSVQAQILRLLLNLKDEFGLSIILVTHDLSVVSQACDRVVVMYAGRVIETAPTDELLAAPRHPYSKGLIDSRPESAPTNLELPQIPGQPPLAEDSIPGCAFEPRCMMARPRCRTNRPELSVTSPHRASACHFWSEIDR